MVPFRCCMALHLFLVPFRNASVDGLSALIALFRSVPMPGTTRYLILSVLHVAVVSLKKYEHSLLPSAFLMFLRWRIQLTILAISPLLPKMILSAKVSTRFSIISYVCHQNYIQFLLS